MAKKEVETKKSEETKKFVVLHDFTDLEDDKKVYRKDKVYPNPANKKVSDERIAALTSKNNKQNRPVIKEVE